MNTNDCRSCGLPLSAATGEAGAKGECTACALRLLDWQGFEPEKMPSRPFADPAAGAARPLLIAACRRASNSARAAMSTAFERLTRPSTTRAA